MQKVIMTLKVIARLLNDLVAELENDNQQTEQPKAESDATKEAPTV